MASTIADGFLSLPRWDGPRLPWTIRPDVESRKMSNGFGRGLEFMLCNALQHWDAKPIFYSVNVECNVGKPASL